MSAEELRPVEQLFAARPTEDGDGVKIRRVAGQGILPALDPFLMLDEIAADEAADYIGGFPMHPHRGFSTVTYMLEGRMRHQDHMGNEGVLGPGDAQWMDAASGVLHSEMPEQREGRLHGFQLWVNLPAAMKMQAPAYREVSAGDIPSLLIDRAQINVIAGVVQARANGVTEHVTGPIQGRACAVDIAMIRFAEGAELNLRVPEEKNTLIYAADGAVTVRARSGLRQIPSGHLARLGAGDAVALSTQDFSSAMVLAGRPLREPVAHWGPFVMNTPEEIERAITDYREGQLVTLQPMP
ncbi:MAG TPA: quercetin 2,3-dioxygenase [Porticoccaceae bacterium]|nr:quercetin 2,3-dioxygenase [Porticoccaceae bacterium]